MALKDLRGLTYGHELGLTIITGWQMGPSCRVFFEAMERGPGGDKHASPS